jgi:energy-converting hydrogenase A subunit M
MKKRQMNTDILTIQLPTDEISFLRQYAERHRITISELIDRYARGLQVSQTYDLHPDIQKITGIIPKDIDTDEIFYQHSMEKHT